jgi:hypothetical protein
VFSPIVCCAVCLAFFVEKFDEVQLKVQSKVGHYSVPTKQKNKNLQKKDT